MQEYKLNTGFSIPVIGLGTWQMTGPTVKHAVLSALQVGYRHIDTAALYANEKEIGDAVRNSSVRREDVFVTTKLWNTDHANPHAAFERSLEKLGFEYVDLYLIHWPVPERNRTWEVFEKILDSEKCRSVGVSNFTVEHLEELFSHTSVVPAVNQVEFTPFLYQKELLSYCRKKGIILEAYSPLTRGAKLNDSRISTIASKYGKSNAQIILRWGVQHQVVVLPKSKTPARIKENINIFDFELTSRDMKELDGLNENLRYCWDPNTLA